MKRHLLILAVFLLAGMVVNVAVAWGIALRVNTYGRPSANVFHAESSRTVSEFSEFTAFGTVRYSWRRKEAYSLMARLEPRLGKVFPAIHDALPQWASRHKLYTATSNSITGSGWPLLVFSASIHSTKAATPRHEVLGGLRTPLEPFVYGWILPKGFTLPPGITRNQGTMPRVLPLRPIWTGLLINTFFYAPILLVLWEIVRRSYPFAFRCLILLGHLGRVQLVQARFALKNRDERRRAFLILAAFLLAGAVVNVAVAWGCSLWSPTKGERVMQSVERLPDDLLALMPSDWPTSNYSHTSVLLYQGQSLGFGVRISRVASKVIGGIPFLGPGRSVNVHRAGWPVRSMRCRVLVTRPTRGEPQVLGGFTPNAVFRARTAGVDALKGVPDPFVENDARGLTLLRKVTFGRPAFQHSRPVPCRPIWPGFAINTLFYAAILWLLICGPFALRRLIRVRRGLCPACAYPRSESAVCSECGKALPQQAKAAT